MKNNTMKKIISLCMVALLLFSFVPLVFAEASVLGSGYCGGEGEGKNLTWTLYDNGHLVISGNGKMADYNEGITPPWKDLLTSIGQSELEHIADMTEEELDKFMDAEIIHLLGYSSKAELKAAQEQPDFNQDAFLFNLECVYNAYVMKKVSDKLCALSDGIFIDVQENVTSIGNNAFREFGHSISLPSTLNEIGENAFLNSAITEITIPKNVTKIGNEAFGNLLLNALTIEGTPTIGTLNELSKLLKDITVADNQYDLSTMTVPICKKSAALNYNLYKNYTDFNLAFATTIILGVYLSSYLSEYKELMMREGLNEPIAEIYTNYVYFASMSSLFNMLGISPKASYDETLESALADLNRSLGSDYTDISEMFIVSYDENGDFDDMSFTDDFAKKVFEMFGVDINGTTSQETEDNFDLKCCTIADYINDEFYNDYQIVPWLTIHTNCNAAARTTAESIGIKLDLTHTWGDWKDIKAPTATEEGTRTRTCAICGDQEQQSIPRLDNSSEPTSDPTTPSSTQSDNEHNEDSGKKLNFFQRIIEWFRNLFNKLFGWMKR